MSKQRFSQLMDDLGMFYGREVSPSLKRMYWDDLDGHPIDCIEAAAQRHRRDPQRGRYFPTTADLLAQMPGPQSITADEAWALCLQSLDESETVVISDAIIEARSVAMPILDARDTVGARLAFCAAYDRAMLKRQHAGRVVTWQVSPGWDAEKRGRAVERAVASGLLSQDQARHYLPAPKIEGAGAAIAGLLSGNVVPMPGLEEKYRRHLANILETLKPNRGRGELMAEERERFEARKRRELANLEEFGRRLKHDEAR